MQRILVVEDEQMLAKIIGMKLEEEKYTVEHAYDGEEAYKMLCQPDLPDLVLLDVLLPKLSGFDVLERLRAEQRTLPKIIIFSNFAQKSDVERAHQLGAVDYILKAAFSPAEILSKIKTILQDSGQAPKKEAAASANAYSGFDSMQEVMPMSEVLHPGESTSNPEE